MRFEVDEYNKNIRSVQKQIGELMKSNKGSSAPTELLAQKERLEKDREGWEKEMNDKESLLQAKLATIGNLVHDSVIVSNTEVIHPL